MARKTRTVKRVSSELLVATGTSEEREKNQLSVSVQGWTVLLECEPGIKPRSSIEHDGQITLVHFDFPGGPLGEYHISVQQPFIDIHRSWAGAVDCWRGTELTSIALNYNFESAANSQIPVICNYDRHGENRGVIGLLDHSPRTQVNQRPLLDEPPMHLMQTKFTRRRPAGGLRETMVICREKIHFSQAVQKFMRFCRVKNQIQFLPAPRWAREPVWCSWYSHLYVLTQKDVLAQIPLLKKIGVRTVLIDASWFKKAEEAYFRKSGDYVAEKTLFPDLLGLSRKLHEQGMKLMLWTVPHFVGVHSMPRKKMEKHCAHDGKERSYVLCPFSAEARKYVKETTARIMREYELDGLKIDFMDFFERDCKDPKHDHGDGNHGAAVLEIMRSMRDGILETKPDAAIEYRLNYSTLATQPFATSHRGNDAPYDADYIRRENLFLRLFCEFPAAVWSDYAYWHANENPNNISHMLGMQIFSGGVPTISIDMVKTNPRAQSVMKRWMRFYHQHLDALARAELTVHSADSFLSVSSLEDAASGDAFLLLAGQHIPRKIKLKTQSRRVWILNVSAEKSGELQLHVGKKIIRVMIKKTGLLETKC